MPSVTKEKEDADAARNEDHAKAYDESDESCKAMIVRTCRVRNDTPNGESLLGCCDRKDHIPPSDPAIFGMDLKCV